MDKDDSVKRSEFRITHLPKSAIIYLEQASYIGLARLKIEAKEAQFLFTKITSKQNTNIYHDDGVIHTTQNTLQMK